MARIRTVKPELFKHEDLFELEKETKLPIRLCFIGLFTCCDREGRFKWRPRTLKLDVIPYDDIDFSRVLDALMTRGFVIKYDVNGEEFGVISSFTKHQVINNRESLSELPEPAIGLVIDASTTRQSRVNHAPSGEGKGREGKEMHETSFLEFWSSYPKKMAKQDSLKAWLKIKPDDILKEKILKSIELQKKSKDWLKDNGQYIPHPASWLNSARWDDAAAEAIPAKPIPKDGDIKNGYRYGGTHVGWQKLTFSELKALEGEHNASD